MIETVVHPKVEFVHTPVVNYAIQQNRVPIVRKLSIENCSDVDIADIQVKITCDPEFANNWEHQIGRCSGRRQASRGSLHRLPCNIPAWNT